MANVHVVVLGNATADVLSSKRCPDWMPLLADLDAFFRR